MRRRLFCISLAIATSVLISLAWMLSGGPRSAGSAPGLLPAKAQATAILVEKGARKLTLMKNGKTLGSYNIKLGFAPKGQKLAEGDGKTPEGIYHIDRRNPHSKYHLSLGIDYPSAEQRAVAKSKGVSPGGDIFIHGQPNLLGKVKAPTLPFDWTEGCVALSDKEMEEIFALVPIGTKVTIVP